jgi:hypothetical protein
MAGLFGLGASWLMIPVTALIAALAAAFSGYAGYAVRNLFKRAPRSNARASDKERRLP